MRMRWMFVAVLLAVFGCEYGIGVEEEELAKETGALTCTVRVSGTVRAMGEPLVGAHVMAYDSTGARTAKAVTGTGGTYTLTVCARPAQLRVKAPHRMPWIYRAPTLVTVATNDYRFDTDVGPTLGADGTGRLLTYMARNTPTSIDAVPQMAWGPQGIGGPWDEVGALLNGGARVPQLTTLVPTGTRPYPALETSVVRRTSTAGAYLDLRVTAEANSVAYGSGAETAYITQLVATTSFSEGDEHLPVKVSVRCRTCPSGYTPLRDGHLGPDGPSGSYYPPVAPPEQAFRDIASHRYMGEIAMAKGLGITTGYADGTFRPDNSITRAELAAMLVSTLGLTPESPCTPGFRDVPATAWYCGSVETARAYGLTSGYTDGTYRPTGAVTRAELAAFLARAARWPLENPTTASFTDVARTYWGFRQVETAYAWCRAIEPRDLWGTRFEPAASATRAEVVAGLVRTLECFTGDEVRP